METSVVTAPPLVPMESRAEDDVFRQLSVSHVQLCLQRRLRSTSADPLHSGHRLHLLKSLSLVVYYGDRHQSAQTLKPLTGEVNNTDQLISNRRSAGKPLSHGDRVNAIWHATPTKTRAASQSSGCILRIVQSMKSPVKWDTPGSLLYMTLPSPEEGKGTRLWSQSTQWPNSVTTSRRILESFWLAGLHLHGCVHVFCDVLGPLYHEALLLSTVSGSLVF